MSQPRKNFFLAYFISFVLFFLIIGLVISRCTAPPKVIYFYGQRCPHCLTINEFITEQQLHNSLAFLSYEISSPEQSQLFYEKAASCGLDRSQAGVPFVFDGRQRVTCYLGLRQVLDFFEKELK